MNYKDSFWNSAAVNEMYSLDNAEQVILHPFVAEIIHSFQPQNCLDYGCGDAFVDTLLDEKIQVALYDKNIVSLRKTFHKRAKPNFKMFASEQEIPNHYFDCILYSQVMMCISNKFEQLAILKKLYVYKKKTGKLVIVITHPCFLQYEFGHWYTSYAKHQPFKYLSEGEHYSVYMKRYLQPVVFQDYNWSLSFIINTIIKAGFKLEKMIEHKDMCYNINVPQTNFPHYMFLICS
jgi:SAM-dependent methyltransferase